MWAWIWTCRIAFAKLKIYFFHEPISFIGFLGGFLGASWGLCGDLVTVWIISLQELPVPRIQESREGNRFMKKIPYFKTFCFSHLLKALSFFSKLMALFHDFFQDMNQTYDSTSCLLAVHRGWKGGIHIQSCGHHMHYDCRSSYCETLRSTLR